MTTKPTTITEFLASLSDDRRTAIKALRKVIRANIDKPFKESIESGMLSYSLPHSVYPNGYHCNPEQPLPFASIASQKSHIGLYLFCVYCQADGPDQFREEWLAAGKKLNMGKSCVRVKKLDDIPLEVVGRAFKRMTAKKFVAAYEAGLSDAVKTKLAKNAAKSAGKKVAKKAAGKGKR